MLESDHRPQLKEPRTAQFGATARDEPAFSVGILDTESVPAAADFLVTGRSRNRDITSFVWLSFRS
jgi:hypothetical protein